MSIRFDQLSKTYGSRIVLKNISFECPTGTITGLLGQNGAGKSTALRCLLALSRSSSGSATINGQMFASLEQPQLMVGAVLDASVHHPGRTAKNTVGLVASLLRLPPTRVDQMLELVGLRDAAKVQFRALSLGMKQRLALAIALLPNPSYLILDEPLNGLDVEGVSWFRDLVADFSHSGGTVLVSSHMLAELQVYADRVVTIHDGEVLDNRDVVDLPGARDLALRSSDDAALTALLAAEGLAPRTDPKTLHIYVSAGAELVSQLAFAQGILLYEIVPQRTQVLESYYLDLVTKARN